MTMDKQSRDGQGFCACLALMCGFLWLPGCSLSVKIAGTDAVPVDKKVTVQASGDTANDNSAAMHSTASEAATEEEFNREVQDYSRLLVSDILDQTTLFSQSQVDESQQTKASSSGIQEYGEHVASDAMEGFFKGRYNRSRARLPENIEKWRSQIDVSNPGSDLANFPNSAFTLPQGRAYIELSPLAYYGTASGSPAQYNTEYLIRYGATDNIELRLFGNGVTWSGGASPVWGFSPIAFDTKIHLWGENEAYFLPAAGFEAYVQTEWLSSNAAFNQGTQPSFTFNFDQSLPFDIDFEYNLGTTRTQLSTGQNVWQFSFQWALQRDFLSKDFAVFIHGFYNAMTLPRLPVVVVAYDSNLHPSQNAVGAGFVWTVNHRLQLYGQTSGGVTTFTPSIISTLGFVVAF